MINGSFGSTRPSVREPRPLHVWAPSSTCPLLDPTTSSLTILTRPSCVFAPLSRRSFSPGPSRPYRNLVFKQPTPAGAHEALATHSTKPRDLKGRSWRGNGRRVGRRSQGGVSVEAASGGGWVLAGVSGRANGAFLEAVTSASSPTPLGGRSPRRAHPSLTTTDLVVGGPPPRRPTSNRTGPTVDTTGPSFS